MKVIAGREDRLRPGPAGVFPFRLVGQTIDLFIFGAEPFAKFKLEVKYGPFLNLRLKPKDKKEDHT